MTIDLIFLMVFVYAFSVGFRRGIIQSLSAVLSIIIGFVAAVYLTPNIKMILEAATRINNTLLPFVAFLATFMGGIFLVRIGAKALESAVNKADLDMVNKFAGGIAFSIIGILVFSGLLIFFEKAHLLNQTAMDDSAFFPYLKAFPEMARDIFARFSLILVDMWEKMIEMFEQIGENQATS